MTYRGTTSLRSATLCEGPLGHPEDSIPFTGEILTRSASEFDQNSLAIAGHLYLSRGRVETLTQLLQPNSPVFAKHVGPDREKSSAMGHRVRWVLLQREVRRRASSAVPLDWDEVKSCGMRFISL